MKNNHVPRQAVLRTMIAVFILSFIVGCGTKKRVVHIERGVEIENETRNIVSEETFTKTSVDTSKTKTNVKKEESGSVVETWVWRKDGSPAYYKKEIKGISNTVTETEEFKGLSGSDSSTSQIVDLSVLSREVSSEVIDDNLEKDNPTPAFFKGWWWVMVVGVATVLAIMGVIVRR